MTTAEQNPVAHLLDGMVRCQNCNAPMEIIGAYSAQTPAYECRSLPQVGCIMPPISAEPLARLVVETVIHAALAGGNAQQVAKKVREDARQRIIEYDEVAATGVAPRFVVDSITQLPGLSRTFPAVRVLDESETTERVAALRRLNKYWNLTGDTGHVEQYALDLDTYLRPSNLQTTRAIIEAAVAEVGVGPVSTTIRYKSAMPLGSGDEGTYEAVVNLPGL